jgi:hypothetical protein
VETVKTKAKTKKRGTVEKVIKPVLPGMPEKAQISVHEADHLYKEIRIDNSLHDGKGDEVKLKENADVDILIEAEPEATVEKNGQNGKSGKHPKNGLAHPPEGPGQKPNRA